MEKQESSWLKDRVPLWGTAAAILAITMMVRDKAQEDVAVLDEYKQAQERGEELDMQMERIKIKRYIAEVVKEMYDAEDGEDNR